jgi:hypothetical protein
MKPAIAVIIAADIAPTAKEPIWAIKGSRLQSARSPYLAMTVGFLYPRVKWPPIVQGATSTTKSHQCHVHVIPCPTGRPPIGGQV